MLFAISKLVDIALMPLSWVLLLLLLGLHRRCAPYRRALMASAIVLLGLLGWEPLPDALLRPLEIQYAEIAPDADVSGFVGIVVLGGAQESGYLARSHAQPLLNDAAERMTAAVALARRHAHLQVVFTGGNGEPLTRIPSEAERARAFLQSQGVDLRRVRFESAARTTRENAVLSAQLVGAQAQSRWLLVTSAWHMPRAMAHFERAGWNVVAYPVDYRTGPATPWTHYHLDLSLRKWHLALHEYVGLLARRLE